GPSEDTTYSTFADIPAEEPGSPAIGRPIAGTRAYVVDAGMQPVLPGAVAQLFLAGSGLARGYLGRPDLTAERFVPDPFAASPGERLYRTGDLARWLPAGELEHRGRTDHQVKVRGFRVELGEIEAALRRLPGVREAAAVVREEPREEPPGERWIAAYVVPAGEPAPSGAELRAALRDALPDYMLPAVVVPLDALPLTPSGKIDRRALPATAAARPAPDREPGAAAPRGPVEELIAGIWADLLRQDHAEIAPHASFFDLGGHSLLAARVLSRLRAVLGVELPFRAVFDEPTLAGFAARVERALQESAGEGSAPPPLVPPLVPIPRGGRLLPSYSQQRLWFLDQLDPGSSAYNLASALRLEGVLDAAALAGALSGLARRHESLRTTFGEEDGEPRLVIAEPAPLPLPVVDLAGLPAAPREAEARRIVTAEARRPYDLARGPLARAALLRLAEREHALFYGMHHIVSDGWSLGVLMREIGALYAAFAAGRPSPLAELPEQYADYAAWQRRWLAGEVLAAEIAYWRELLRGLPARLELPTDRPRP
ncbi:MAG TPA: condensation domain-containing protein, partial [Thermoanaerobaculia bacterium]